MESHSPPPGDLPMENTLFGLPLELRAQIYRFAFVESETASSKIIALEKWMQQERDHRRIYRGVGSQHATFINNPRPPHTRRSIPTCPLTKMLVNKQFFDEAATSFLRYQMIECDDMRTLNRLFKASPHLRKNVTRLICKWELSAELGLRPLFRYFSGVASCKSLRELHITVYDEVFDAFKNQLACVHDFSGTEFKEVSEVHQLVRMPSLKAVKLTAHRSRLATTEVEQRQWRKNVAGLEHYINKQLKQAKEAKPVAAKGKAKIPSFEEDVGELSKSIFAELAEASIHDGRSRGFWGNLKYTFSRQYRTVRAADRKTSPKDSTRKAFQQDWTDKISQPDSTRKASYQDDTNKTSRHDSSRMVTQQDASRKTLQYVPHKIRGQKPTGVTKQPKAPPRVAPPTTTSTGLTRKHIAMTAGISFAVSSVTSIGLMKLMAG